MRETARVVIIGGGVHGASLLYHLAKEGWTDCILVEKAELTSGSTWHAAGQITRSIGDYTTAAFHHYALELYHDLPGETCLLYTSPSPRDRQKARMPSSA